MFIHVHHQAFAAFSGLLSTCEILERRLERRTLHIKPGQRLRTNDTNAHTIFVSLTAHRLHSLK